MHAQRLNLCVMWSTGSLLNGANRPGRLRSMIEAVRPAYAFKKFNQSLFARGASAPYMCVAGGYMSAAAGLARS